MKRMTQHKTGAQQTSIKQLSPWTGKKVLVLVELPTRNLKKHSLILTKKLHGGAIADLGFEPPTVCLSKATALFTRHTAPYFHHHYVPKHPLLQVLVLKQPFSKKLFLLTQEKSQPEFSPDLKQHSSKTRSQSGEEGVPSG